jgi:hypothetical protein
MENLTIPGSTENYFIPSVNFDANTGLLEISGESYLEDTKSFYDPILKWLTDFTKNTEIPVTFNIKLSYYNTSSSRSILEMFYVLKEFEENGGYVQINWFYNEEDEDVEEEVEDFELDSGLKISLKKLEEE